MPVNRTGNADRIMLELLKEALHPEDVRVNRFPFNSSENCQTSKKDAEDVITGSGYESLSGTVWREIFDTAERHLILPMVFDAVFRSASYEKLESAHRELFTEVKKKASGEVLRQYGNTASFLDLYEYLEGEGIRPLVVKGIVCRSLYPRPAYRQSWDEDILVSPDDFEACHHALLRYGLTVESNETDLSRTHEIAYRDHSSCLMVELHRSLFDPDSSVFGEWNGLFRDVSAHACRMDVNDAGEADAIWTLAPQQHLFYLICHTFKHFLYFGAGLRQITDILVFCQVYSHQIDWLDLQDICRAIRAERFTADVFSIGEEYLGFEAGKAGIPQSWLDLAGDTGSLLADILEAGMQANTSRNRIHSSSMTLAAAAAEQSENADDHGSHRNPYSAGILRALFPPVSSLRQRCPYLESAPYLLPAAWVQRLIQYGFETMQKGDSGNAAETIRIGNERIRLLRSLDVIGNKRHSPVNIGFSKAAADKKLTRHHKPSRDRNNGAFSASAKEDLGLSGRIKSFGIGFLGGRIAPAASCLWKLLFRIQWYSLDLMWKMKGFRMPGPKEQRAVRENVTFIFKSFERQDMAVELYRNIQRYYPGTQVIIADDSREPLHHEAPFLKIINLPFNSGLGLGISRALEQVETPYVVRMDDDELITRKTQFGKQLIFLKEHPEVDIVTMGFITVAHHHPDKDVWPAYYKQSMTDAPKKLLIRHMTKLDETHRVLGKGPNIYLARTESIRKVGYDENIRMIDHHEFFTRAAGVLVTVGAQESFVFHRHDPFDLEYRKYRNDTLADQEYIKEKYKINHHT